ncbi:MAG: succinylglutamate desuccinylase/aspartoacylase family protein [Planctomycetes bacterium]|nr:succinylglutamate desuccinylase/aspartoacylase family protein [Planctomycetota bacterium]
MVERIRDSGVCLIDSGSSGPSLCIAGGVRGDEPAPVDAIQQLLAMFATDELGLSEGKVLLLASNPRALAQDLPWSKDGVDLDRCFHPAALARPPGAYEERRAREIVRLLAEAEIEILVDFHAGAAPGRGFLVQQAPLACPRHIEVTNLLAARVLISDPLPCAAGAPLDRVLFACGGVGVRYELGCLEEPRDLLRFARDEMINLMAGLGMILGRAFRTRGRKERLEVRDVLLCEAGGFRWFEGMERNLQPAARGTALGAYPDGRRVTLEADAVLILPARRADPILPGEPLVFLAAPAP